jgi:hypothetical protein
VLFQIGEHQIEAAQTNTLHQRTETRAILAGGVVRCDWRRRGRMVGRASVGRYRPLSMAFGLEDLFDRIIANGKRIEIQIWTHLRLGHHRSIGIALLTARCLILCGTPSWIW